MCFLSRTSTEASERSRFANRNLSVRTLCLLSAPSDVRRVDKVADEPSINLWLFVGISSSELRLRCSLMMANQNAGVLNNKPVLSVIC